MNESQEIGLVTCHILGAPMHHWIIDLGVTCHICCVKELIDDLHTVQEPQEVSLGDGRTQTEAFWWKDKNQEIK